MKARSGSGYLRRWLPAVAAALLACALGTSAASDDDQHLTLESATFQNGGTLPLSMISTIPNGNGQNSCTASGAAGGNQSPQLSWQHAPEGTRSFAIVAYDITAQFTHWVMYNIPADTTSLAENAGVAGSGSGVQNGNDFFQPNYNGPCPPTTLMPFSHEYQFTVYALDRMLPVVQTFGDFVPAGPEGFYQELIRASRHGHVLASATIAGFFSAVPGT